MEQSGFEAQQLLSQTRDCAKKSDCKYSADVDNADQHEQLQYPHALVYRVQQNPYQAVMNYRTHITHQ